MTMPKPAPAAVRSFEALLPTGPGVTVRKMFGQPAAFVAGNMFFGVFGSSVFLRLSEDDRLEAFCLPGVGRFEPVKGRPMKEYITLPGPLLADEGAAGRWIQRSLLWARRLPGKRSRAAAGGPKAAPGGAGRTRAGKRR